MVRTGNKKGKPSKPVLDLYAEIIPEYTKNTRSAIDALDRMEVYFNYLHEVGFYPHSGQQPILKRLFSPKYKIRKAFCQCSRNFGKTSLATIFSVGKAISNIKFKIYIIGPYLSQTIEIYCQGGDLDRVIPPVFYAIPYDTSSYFNKSEMRWSFDTESFIKLDGADNEARVRGLKPHSLVADEFQDWRKSTWEAMEPNLIPNNAPVLFTGTPPEIENVYTEQALEVKTLMYSGDTRYFYTKKTIYDNPLLPLEAIEKIKTGLLLRGEELTWNREYMAMEELGGSRSIYPQFKRKKTFKSEETLRQLLSGRKRSLIPYTVFDPSGSRFACSGFLYDPHSKMASWVFGFAESDINKIATSILIPRVLELESLWYPEFSSESPYRIYDEAAKLWAIDVITLGIDLIPTAKKHNEKSNVILLGRDILLNDRLEILDTLILVAEEFEEYHYDENNKIHKKKDDLIDTFHYFIAESGYEVTESDFPLPESLPSDRKPPQSISEDYESANLFDFTEIGDYL